MIPVMNRNTTYRINIPELSGGLNLRDGLTLIKDNQLTDELNMWNKGGLLRTRPAIRSKESLGMFEFYGNEKYDVTARTTTDIVIINGKKYVLEYEIYSKTFFDDAAESVQKIVLRLRSTANDIISLGEITSGDIYYTNMHCLPIVDNGDVYVYVCAQHVFADANDYSVWKIERDGNTYKTPEQINDEIYIPTVLTNCVSSYGETLQKGQLPRNAQQLEGFNLLGDKYKVIFSTYDYTENALTDDPEGKFRYMEFVLPYTSLDLWGQEGGNYQIVAEHTDKNGVIHKHAVPLPNRNETTIETQTGADGYFLASKFDANGVCRIWFTDGTFNNSVSYTYNRLRNNLVVTAPMLNTQKNKEKVFKMTRSIWYGNTSLGLSGGNRLFLGGNTNEREKALLVWSDLKNPLYFSENNYNYVGDKSQAITAFGKQGSSLVIFKENETYSTQYNTNSITAEDVVGQNIIDTSANIATFPMTLINSQIGCKCPDTVQLCRNRLVWADKNGKVYTLTAQNQYSERNIYEVGEMLYKELAKCDLSKAQSADWEDHYLLFVGENVFVMDYNSYGYTNIASYTKSDDANSLIPWHKWKLPINVSRATHAEGLVLTRLVFDNTYVWWMEDMDMTFDKKDRYYKSLPDMVDEEVIPCYVQTKLFDFGYPERYKTIKKVCMNFGDNGGEPITVQCITDTADNDETIITLLTDENGPDSPKYIKNKQIVPYTKFSSRFGLKIACEGQMLIESMTMEYKNAGGIR